MNNVESVKRELQRVGLDKLEWVSRLRLVINTHHLETRTRVTHCGAACTTEKIKQS